MRLMIITMTTMVQLKEASVGYEPTKACTKKYELNTTI